MPTSWAQASSEMIRSALEHMQVIDAVQTPSAEDSATCLKALNGLLKELPVYGYLWPEYREGVAVSWTSGADVTLPDDFYGFPYFRRSDGVPLIELTPARWAEMDATTRAQTAEKPTHFYVSGTTATLWPIPTTNPGLTLNYQSKADDAASAVTPDVPQSWHNALPWGIAAECWMKFGVPPMLGEVIEMKWAQKLRLLLASAAPTGPVDFSVAD